MTEPTEARSDITPSPLTPADTTRALILAQPDLKRVPIDIEDWPALKGQLYVRKMKASERSAFERSMDFDPRGNPRNIENLQTRLAILTLVTKDGDRIFSDEHLEELSGKSALAMQEIFSVAAELNGLTEAATEALAGN